MAGLLTRGPCIEGEGSHYFSITQLVGQKKAITKLANASQVEEIFISQ